MRTRARCVAPLLQMLLACGAGSGPGTSPPAAQVTYGAVYHVDASASGGGNGRSRTDAWTRLSAIDQSILAPGDVVRVYSGTYDERLIIAKGSEAPAARITYQGVDSGGGAPVIRGIAGGRFDGIAVIGFEITHGSAAYPYPAIQLAGASGWLIQDVYLHDTATTGIDLHYGTVNDRNVIRANRLARIGMTPGHLVGAPGIVVYGDANLVEYNTLGLVSDYVEAFGTGNIVRNNYGGHSSELELMDANPPRLDATGGSWDSASGRWSKPGADVSAVTVGSVIRVFPDGGDPYGFASAVTAVDAAAGAVTAALTHAVGAPPPSGTGNTSAIALAGAHIDCFQSFASTRPLNKLLIENNWFEDDDSINSHGTIIQDDGTHGLGWLVQRGNVYARLGSYTHVFTGFSGARIYNNTFYAPMLAAPGAYNAVVSYATADSPDHAWINDTWDYTGMSAAASIFSGGFHSGLVADYDHVFGGSALPPGEHDSTAPPLFTDEVNGDFTLQPASPLRGAGRWATVAVGAGQGATRLIVADPTWFTDGWGIAEGDRIAIAGGAPVAIVAIDYAAQALTLGSPATWADGDPVRVTGMEDIGALPYARWRGFTLALDTRAAPAGDVTLTATVLALGAEAAPEDVVRKIEYLVDGLPVGSAYGPPYAVTYVFDGEPHTVEARAYRRWASRSPIQSAVRSLAGSP